MGFLFSSSSQTHKIEFDFIHALQDWFLAENWTLVKFKSNSKNWVCLTTWFFFLFFLQAQGKLKNWVWFCTCARGLLFSWEFNFRQAQVILKGEFDLIHVFPSQAEVKLQKFSLNSFVLKHVHILDYLCPNMSKNIFCRSNTSLLFQYQEPSF